MAAQVRSSWLDKVIAPRSLLAGVLVAFLACCLLGRLTASVNIYQKFLRFHFLMNTQTQFFPTPSQVRALGKATLEPERIAVVVGSNSILYGHGQNEQNLWSTRLQEHLGDRYRVINLATPGALPWEFGELAAEMLAPDRPKMVFISCIRAFGRTSTRPDGRVYQQFFWDAYYKGLVPPDAEREQRLQGVLEKEKPNGPFQEMRLRLALDSVLYANDLWTTVSYCWVNTLWLPQLQENFLKPRHAYHPPLLPTPPPDDPCLRAETPERMAIVSKLAGSCDGKEIARCCAATIPKVLRERTCMLVVRECPLYSGQLEPKVRERYEAYFPVAVRELQQQGFTAQQVGEDFTDRDYYDWIHLNEHGGDRMAEKVAVEVRALAERLGYLDREGQR